MCNKEIHLADGGLGSTLEDVLNFKIAHTPLWSTRAAVDGEKLELIIQAHLMFLRAGARMLLTSTYQAAFETFESEGYSREQSLQIMANAIIAADRARVLFCAEADRAIRPSDIRIVLSLGTFGSTIKPMQDFDGIFPPPYGPRAYSATHPEQNTTSFGDDAEGAERSVRALADFHAERLLAYARMVPEVWDLVDAVAFETVPIAREVTAIRRAVTGVVDILSAEGRQMKSWWVTAVFLGGRCSETRVPGGEGLLAGEVAKLMVQPGHDGDGRALATPWGIGFNCVAMEYLQGLLKQFEEECARVMGDDGKWPWLVIKPNGGKVDWAEEAAKCVEKARMQRWQGLIVGGCCHAGPDDIASLASKV